MKKIITVIILLAVLALGAYGIKSLVNKYAGAEPEANSITKTLSSSNANSNTEEEPGTATETRTVNLEVGGLTTNAGLSGWQYFNSNASLEEYAGKDITITLTVAPVEGSTSTSYGQDATLYYKIAGTTEEQTLNINIPNKAGTVTVNTNIANLTGFNRIFWERNNNVLKCTGATVSAEFPIEPEQGETGGADAELNTWGKINNAYMQYGELPGYVFYALTILAVILVLIILIKIIKEV